MHLALAQLSVWVVGKPFDPLLTFEALQSELPHIGSDGVAGSLLAKALSMLFPRPTIAFPMSGSPAKLV
ncbi:MAG: hypothetical protein K2W94_07195 [Alphaproteobacteria bacterium]|nr:hypothetical protein [Alphaproteobacteria bacterium]